MSPYSAPAQPTYYTSLLGSLELVTAPSGQVLTTAEAKLHLRVDHTDDDGYINDLIIRAAEYAEKNISGHRQLLTATYDLPVRDWWTGPLRLPRPPLVSVTSLKYYDTAGVQQTVSSTLYEVRTPWRQPGWIERAPTKTWPAAYQSDRRFPLTIRFVSGYGAAAAVPTTLKQAMLLLIGHWYEHRLAVGPMNLRDIPLAVASLLDCESYGSYA